MAASAEKQTPRHLMLDCPDHMSYGFMKRRAMGAGVNLDYVTATH